MKPDWRCLKEDGIAFVAEWNISRGNEQVHAADAPARRNPQRDFLSGNGNDLSHRTLHHHGIGEVDQMKCH